MAIEVYTDVTTGIDSRTLSCTIPTLVTNDVCVFVGITWDQTVTLANPSGTGLAFGSPIALAQASNKSNVYIWGMKATSGGSSVAVTTAPTGGNSMHNGWLYRFPTADGYDLAGSPNFLQQDGSSNPNGSLSGANGNPFVVAVGDWSGTDGASRVWYQSATEDAYVFSSTNNTHYGAHGTLTGASTTVGLSTWPSGGNGFWTIAALEILYSAPIVNYNVLVGADGKAFLTEDGKFLA